MAKIKKIRRTGNKAVFYGRFSCDKQQEQSITGQLDECTKYAQREGYEIVKTFTDEAISGREMDKRLGLYNMLEYVRYHDDIAYIIVYKIDRLGRNVCDINQIKKEMSEIGVRVLKATELNGEGAAGFLTDAMFEAFAEYYSMELSEKTARGMRQSAKNGTSTGSYPPMGYKWVQKKLVIDDTKSPAIKLAFELYAKGIGKAEICRQLNDLGYTNRWGKPFKIGDFANLFSCKKYIGEWWQNGELVNPQGNEPLIDRDTFEACQKMLKANAINKGGEVRQKREYAVSGKLYCMYCGAPMIAKGGTGRGDKQYYYYICKNALRSKSCCKKTERQDKIDEWVGNEIISTFGLSSDTVDQTAMDIAELYRQRNSGTGLEIKRKALAKEEKSAAKLCDLLIEADESTTLLAKLRETEQRIKELKEQIAESEVEERKLPDTKQIKKWLSALIEKGYNGISRDLIKTCIHSIYIDNNGRAVIFWRFSNRQLDEDIAKSIIEEQKNIPTDECGDVEGFGSLSACSKERFSWGVVGGRLCLVVREERAVL